MKLCLIGADGEGVVQITEEGPYDDEAPAWAPDGQAIVFGSNRLGKSQLFVISPDGTGLIRLSNHPAAHSSPAWSPK